LQVDLNLAEAAIAELEADLVEEARQADEAVDSCRDRIAELEAEMAALKCCGNCGHYDQKSGDEVMNCYAYLDPDDCDQASPFDHCHFTPSRWQARPRKGADGPYSEWHEGFEAGLTEGRKEKATLKSELAALRARDEWLIKEALRWTGGEMDRDTLEFLYSRRAREDAS